MPDAALRYKPITTEDDVKYLLEEFRAGIHPTPANVHQQARVASHRNRLVQDALINARRLAERIRERRPLPCCRCDKRDRLESLHSVLVAVAHGVREARGQEHATSITIHSAVELIAAVHGWGLTATNDNLNILEGAGLIARRAHITTTEIEGVEVSRCDGVLINVKLAATPAKARLTLEELRSQPRNLTADRRAGRTVYRLLQEPGGSLTQENKTEAIQLLLNWSLSPGNIEIPLEMTHRVFLDERAAALWDVPHAPFEARDEVVEHAASEIVAMLGDQGSLHFWCDVLWRMLRRLDTGQLAPNMFDALRNLLERARVAKTHDQWARNPAAYAVSELKKWSLWEELQRTPLTRVGTRPLSA